MNKRRFYQALVLGLLVALCVIGCSNQHFFNNHKKENISFIFVTPQTSSRSTESDGSIWNIHAWIEKDDGTIIESKLLSATSGSPVLVEFQEVIIDTTIQIKVELQNEAIGKDKYVGSSPFIHLTNNITHVNIDLGYAFYGSQANPITNWTDLKSTMERDYAPSQIYIAGNMEATETITFISNNSTEIIAVNSATITRSSGFTSGPLFETATNLTFTGTAATPITFTGNNVEADSPIISAEADLTMTYCTIQNSINKSISGGGAINIIDTVLVLNNCTFLNNQTSSQGGALNIEGSSSSSQITSCTFEGNSASDGGGAIIYNGDVSTGTNYTHSLQNCTFDANVSGSNGAGIYIFKGFVTIDGISMSEESADNQDIFLYFESSLTLTGHVSIHGLHYNFTSNAYPTLQVISPLDKGSDVSIIMSPSSTSDYPGSLQLFTMESNTSFEWVNNFTVTGKDGSQYTLNDYGLINKVN